MKAHTPAAHIQAVHTWEAALAVQAGAAATQAVRHHRLQAGAAAIPATALHLHTAEAAAAIQAVRQAVIPAAAARATAAAAAVTGDSGFLPHAAFLQFTNQTDHQL